MEFSEKLRVASEESGLNLKEISNLSEIPYSTLKKYSQGKRNPKIEVIQKIATIPQLGPWRELLLDQSELTSEESEIMILIGRMKAQGREDELLSMLREVEQRGDGE